VTGWKTGLDDPVDGRALALLRIAAGPIVLIHLRPFLEAALDGTIYSDRFYLPFVSWYPELPRSAYVALLWLLAAGAVFLSIGLATRLIAWLIVGGVAYNLFLSQTHFHHNRAFLIILLVGLAVLPSGSALSVDRILARRAGSDPHQTGSSGLALTVLRLEVATVYFASGFSKLIDSDWIGGTVTRIRVERYAGDLLQRGWSDGLVDLLADPGFHAVAAPIVVATELFIGAGLLWRRTRLGAVWVAIPFHLSIEVFAEVQVFSIAGLAALVIWVTPARHDRTVRVRSHRRARWVRALDWTGRFRVEVDAGLTSIEVGDRRLRRRGRDAALFTASRLPLTFWLAAPWLLLTRGRGTSGVGSRQVTGQR